MVFSNEFCSTAIDSAAYDTDTKELKVTFVKNGRPGNTYKYYDVPFDEYRGLAQAESAGRYLNRNIIGVYDYDFVK